jgi:hypothetical protein
MKMKTILLMTTLAAALAFTGSAFAKPTTEIPNCWSESNEPLQDGAFLVSLNAAQVSGTKLASALDLIQGMYTMSPHFPMVFGDSIVVLVQAVDYGVGNSKLSREELKKQVQMQIQKVLNTGTVKYIECNRTDIFPMPGSTVHN